MIAKLFSNTSTENVMPVSVTETLNDNVSEQNSHDTDEESNADEVEEDDDPPEETDEECNSRFVLVEDSEDEE